MKSGRRASESAMKRDVVEVRGDAQCHAALPERVVGDAGVGVHAGAFLGRSDAMIVHDLLPSPARLHTSPHVHEPAHVSHGQPEDGEAA